MANVFAGFSKLIKKLFGRNEGYTYQRLSRFAYFLDGVEEDDPEYEPGHTAVLLCDESLMFVGRRVSLTESLKKAEDRLNELDCYNALSEMDAQRLKSLFERHKSISRDKSQLMTQVISFSGTLLKLAELEGKEDRVLRDLEDAENSARAFKRDVATLTGEKGALEDELATMRDRMEFTRKFGRGLTWAFASLAVIMAFAFVFAGAIILLPASVCLIGGIVATAFIYAFRRRMRVEIKRNIEMQKRAVGMLNTKSVVYAHYSGFLRGQYRKYSVRGSENLRKNLKEYASYKHLTKRLDAVRNVLYQTEDELEQFIKFYHIPNVWPTLEQFIKSVDVDDKRAAHADQTVRKKAIERNLIEIEARQARIWLELDQLAAISNLAARIVAAYESAAERLMENKDKLPEAEETTDEERNGKKLQPRY